MKITGTELLPEVLLFEPQVFGDERGFFLETLRQSIIEEVLPGARFVQQNHSRSQKGVLRGLHFQMERPQGKLVRCARGEIFDVAVDIRPGSKTFGKWVGVYLNDQNHRQIYVPPGFAHGFFVLSDVADVIYQCTEYYHPESEAGILWNDRQLAIEWPLQGIKPIVSAKDAAWPPLGPPGAPRA